MRNEIQQAIIHTFFHDSKVFISRLSTLFHALSKEEISPMARERISGVEKSYGEFDKMFKICYDMILPGNLKEDFLPAELVNDVIKLINKGYDDIKYSLENRSNVLIRGYKSNFFMVIYALIKNSVDSIGTIDRWGRSKGDIRIKVSNNNDFLWLEIVDSGGGIPDDNLDKLFKEGFTTKEHGHGLGLYLSKNIIENDFEGSISLVSPSMGYTSFKIEIPIRK